MNEEVESPQDESALLLKASAKRLFETLMEQTPDRIYIKDRQSKFVSVSKALAQRHKFRNRHDIEGMTDFDVFSIEHAQQAYDDEQEIMRTGVPIINKIEKETWPDGSVSWVSSTKAPLYLGSGRLVGILGISRDVTAETIAQEKLARSEQLLREQNKIMRSDYESAEHVQSVMIPGRIPEVKHINLSYIWKPMTSVGGDIINFPRNPTNCLLFFLGDVCGHGVTAAFYTVLLKYLTAHEAETYNADPKHFLDGVNKEVTGRIQKGFVTGLAGHFGHRCKDGSRSLFLAHAGHRQFLVYRKKDQRIHLETLSHGTVMGLPGCQASEVTEIKLHVGDRFYAFTDGIFETANKNEEEFGMQRLITAFEKASALPIQETLTNVFDTVEDFAGSPNQQDDITILGFEID
ncbi:SpoIIE family protein phosphatase [Coraliomargarita parva]|uniref:SpoIIE family protein phosphatase n=1 Tax=Coraliomargarita parva TaxID=3014050 RepID=UPI0022B326C5|nr:SpoIIE family protein phosphatase [Coraliomargarita parva]